MTPINFPQANCNFGAPDGYTEEQIGTLPAFRGQYIGGNLDGEAVIVVAHMPTDEEREEIAKGGPVYLGMVGGLAPHFLSTSFPGNLSDPNTPPPS